MSMSEKTSTNLSRFSNDSYDPGSNFLMRALWYIINFIFFKSALFPFYGLKRFFLQLFGAKLGDGVIIKPHVNIKYPWNLQIDDYSWIGEGVWIDNLANVKIGKNACISQGAYLLTGNHDYRSSSFNLITKSIQIEAGVWIGAKAIVCPGVHCFSHSLLTVGSVATHDLKEYTIYSGNPAQAIKERIIQP